MDETRREFGLPKIIVRPQDVMDEEDYAWFIQDIEQALTEEERQLELEEERNVFYYTPMSTLSTAYETASQVTSESADEGEGLSNDNLETMRAFCEVYTYKNLNPSSLRTLDYDRINRDVLLAHVPQFGKYFRMLTRPVKYDDSHWSFYYDYKRSCQDSCASR
jgi:hypothetical protein